MRGNSILHASGAKRKCITLMNVLKNCVASDKKGTSLLINKDDSSDKEMEDEKYKEEEENISVTLEDDRTENQDKESTALDDDKTSDDEPYEDNSMFSDEDYEGFAFVQDITCNMNDKAGIPDSWVLLDSQSTVDVFKNKKLLKMFMIPKRLCPYTVTQV